MQNFRICYKVIQPTNAVLNCDRSPLLLTLKDHNHHTHRLQFSQSFGSQRKFPDILYIPKLFRWLGTKIKLKYLQKAWDPDFTEGSFIYGSSQAICRITEIVHRNEPDQLNALMTKSAQFHLKNVMGRRLNDVQRKIIKLTPGDIKLLVPIKVQLIKGSDDKKKCFILLKSLSMKWHEENQAIKLILVVIDTEFTREYSNEARPEWFISLFNIVQCVLVGGGNGGGSGSGSAPLK